MDDKDFKSILTEYTESAAAQKDALKTSLEEKYMKNKKISKLPKYLTGAAAAAVVLFAFFAFVPAGKAFAKTLNENVIQKIFKPKDAKIIVEGQEEDKTLTPDYRKSEESGKNGYVIYIDTEIYKSVTGDGVEIITPDEAKYFTGESERLFREQMKEEGAADSEIEAEIKKIRREIAENYAKYPPVRMEITQTANISPSDSAKKEISELKKKYSEVSSPKETDRGIRVHSKDGTSHDSPVETTYFIDNEAGGTFTVRLKYYLEAAEGHASRFEQMLETFKVVKE